MFSFKRNPGNRVEVDALRERLRLAENQLADLAEEANRLKTALYKLSGRYYARFGTGDVPTQQPDSHLSAKDQLRKQLGIVAGRPAPHKQE